MIAVRAEASLDRVLGYRFKEPGLLAQALTHRSASSRHNERLEFLGDAVLELVITDWLMQRYPEADEGRLSRLRSQLVQQSSLAALARDWHLGERLRLGPGEQAGARRDSLLANALEAVLGAVYQDGGLETVREVVHRCFASHLDTLASHAGDSAPDVRDAKSRLQEYLQARALALPDYAVETVSGPPHQRHFQVSCRTALAERPMLGEGGSRRAAEQQAAERMLAHLGVCS